MQIKYKKIITGITIFSFLISSMIIPSIAGINASEKPVDYISSIESDFEPIHDDEEEYNYKVPYGAGLLGDLPEPEWVESIPLSEPEGTLLSSFDWRAYQGKDWTTIAKNQGNCGSCYCFAALGALESRINIVEGDADLDLDLSDQYVLSCLPSAGNCAEGGWGYYTYYYIKSTTSAGNNVNGIIPEPCLTYQADDSVPCNSKCSDWEDKLIPLAGYGSSSNPSQSSIKNKLINDGPMYVSFSVYSDFYDGSPSFDSYGVYEYKSGSYRGGHAVVLVGYVDTPSNPNYDGYWICKNSWGPYWGPWNNGFFGIAYGEVGIDDYLCWPDYTSTGPETTITNGPSGVIGPQTVTFGWIGSDENTPTIKLVYSYKLEGYDSYWSSWSSSKIKTYAGLTGGTYTFKVRSKDKSGLYDTTPDERTFTISTSTEPMLSFTPNSHNFGDVIKGASKHTSFDIWNSGTGQMTYNFDENADWITITPHSGTSNGEHDTINVDLDTSTVIPGQYNQNIDILTNAGNDAFTIIINIIEDLTPPTVEIIYPTDEDIVKDVVALEWIAGDNYDQNLDIYLYYTDDFGSSWNRIQGPIPNTGTYDWDTTVVLDGLYQWKIVVTDLGDLSSEDTSGFFTVDNVEDPIDNDPPVKPEILTGPSNSKTGVECTFSCRSTDPDDDQILFQWDWGDGTLSEWIGPFESGEICTATYEWESEGNYNVKVWSKDVHGELSEWSDEFSLKIDLYRAFLIGKINNYEESDVSFNFEAVSVISISKKPMSFNKYAQGTVISVAKQFSGVLKPGFIFGNFVIEKISQG